jgi:PAS domain S-box-containing protein
MARVLVVEDSHAQAVALKQILQADGCVVDIALDGQEGLAKVSGGNFDLVLSDILMPGLSGYELCQRIKSDPRTTHIPVLLLTTLRDAADILRGLQCGADNFIMKPYDEEYLRGRIRAMLAGPVEQPAADATEPVETFLGGERFTIRSSKQQVLNYLLSTYEDFVRAKEREHHSRLAEGTLRESLRSLEATLDALWAHIAILDEHGTIIAVNSTWRDFTVPSPLLGMKFGVGTNYLQVCDAATREGLDLAAQLSAGIRAVMSDRRKNFSVEHRASARDHEHWFIIRVTRFTIDGHTRTVIAYTDITERKRAEAALQESQRALSTLMSNLPGMAYRCHIDEQWTMRFVSEGCIALTGYRPADLVNNNTVSYTKLVHPDDRDWVGYARRAAVRKNVPFRFVYRLTTAGGREKWVWEQGRGVAGARGQAIALEGIITDITQRRQAEAAIAEEAQISAALARVGREMISCVDAAVLLDRLCELNTEVLGCDFTRTWLYQAEEDTFGLVSAHGDTLEQSESARLVKIPRPALQSHLRILDHEDVYQDLDPQAAKGPLAAVATQVGTTAALYVALRRGEEITGFLTSGYRGRIEPFTTTQVRIARGLASLASMALETARLVEELDHANRFKSDFLAAMSHELRTPLNVIIGYNSLLLEEAFGPLSPGQVDTAQRIEKNARELLELVSATLDLTRFDSKRVPVNVEEIDVQALMEDVARETGPLLKKPGVQVRWEVGPDLPHLYTDSLKVRMVLKNLIGNAIKFTEKGSVEVIASALDDGVQFTVADTGIGISPTASRVIFEPFQQAHMSISQRYGGAGLGLYLVRRITDMLQGSITVDSETGVGSTFRVWFPSRIDPAGGQARPAPVQHPTADPKSKTPADAQH